MNNKEKHLIICKELNEIYEKKNNDYGDSFSKSYKGLGAISAVTRIGDKYYRLENLVLKGKDNNEVKDESIVDTLMDMANYAIMMIMEIASCDYNKDVCLEDVKQHISDIINYKKSDYYDTVTIIALNKKGFIKIKTKDDKTYCMSYLDRITISGKDAKYMIDKYINPFKSGMITLDEKHQYLLKERGIDHNIFMQEL